MAGKNLFQILNRLTNASTYIKTDVTVDYYDHYKQVICILWIGVRKNIQLQSTALILFLWLLGEKLPDVRPLIISIIIIYFTHSNLMQWPRLDALILYQIVWIDKADNPFKADAVYYKFSLKQKLIQRNISNINYTFLVTTDSSSNSII